MESYLSCPGNINVVFFDLSFRTFRKPTKTHKVAANFDDVDHYYDYVPGSIPDAVLEGLGFTDSGGRSKDTRIDSDDMATGNCLTLIM